MRIALTGTPGTGKTSVSGILSSRGHSILNLTEFIKQNDLREEYEEERDTYEVDTDRLNEALKDREDIIFESHLAHFLDVDLIIVLRCKPDVLAQRLRDRGYGPCKVRENMEAELLDVILCESVDSGTPTFVADTTSCTPEETADAVEDIMKGDTDGHMPGDITWVEEMDKWF